MRPADLSGASPVSSPLRPAEVIGGRFLRSPQAPTFSPTAADDRHDGDIQAAETGEAYADYDDLPSPRWRGRLGTAIVVLCLAGLGAVGAFAYRAVLAGTELPTLPPIIKAENGVPNPGDAQPSRSSQTSIASAGASEEFVSRWPADNQKPPKTVPISPSPGTPPPSALGSAAVAPIATAPAASPPGLPAAPVPLAASAPAPAFLGRRIEATRSSAAPTGQANPIPRPRLPSHPGQNRVPQRRLRSEISLCRSLLTRMAMSAASPRSRSVCRRVRESLRKLPPAGAMRLRWPPNAARPMPRRSFEVSRPSSPTSLAGANQSCAAPISVLRGSITKPRLAPSCQ